MELLIIIVVIAVIVIIAVLLEKNKVANMSPQEREQYLAAQDEKAKENELRNEWGTINPTMVCTHCQEKGRIRTKIVKRKKGISGGKATAAILTAGISMVATGLSRKEGWTQAHCCNCNNTWDF